MPRRRSTKSRPPGAGRRTGPRPEGDALRVRVAKLREMTVEHGCTEAEAASAQRIADDLEARLRERAGDDAHDEQPDAIVSGDGSVYTILTQTRAAKKWVKDNVDLEPWQWVGGAFFVDHRCVDDIVTAMQDAALVVVVV